MKNKNNSNLYSIIAILVLVIIALGFALFGNESLEQSSTQKSELISGEDLLIPPLLEYTLDGDTKNFDLNVQEGSYEFAKGIPSKTYGYNGDILGPTIRFSEGDNVDIHVTNNIGEQTTTHWHGGVVPGSADGGVHNIIQPGKDWTARFSVIQEAATLWYHPHQHEETAAQVYKGLGGFIIIDDENSEALNIPNEYGEDDIPIILQSKDLSENGKLLPYQVSHHEEVNGYSGNTLLVNAQIQPKLEVSTNLIRLRILNGSNSDIYNVSFSGNHEFSVIASDGGFYNEPISIDTIKMHPAKRFEIVLDLADLKGETLYMNINGETQLSINVARSLESKYELPSKLNTLVQAESVERVDRNFDLELIGSMGMMGGSSDDGYTGMPVYAINGKLFDMERVDFEVKNDSVEYWKISNIGSGMGLFHPFHVHATQFNIVEFNGEKPSKLLEGRHDTIVLEANDYAIIAVPFDKSLEGIYMYHCHILEHEDAGMMGQFRLY